MNRRSMRSALPISIAAISMPATAAHLTPTVVEWDLLSELTQSLVVMDYWRALSTDQKRIACDKLRDQGLADLASELMPEFTGPGIYEFKVLDDEDGTRFTPTAFLDRAPGRRGWFRWQHYWDGKFQGRGRLVPEGRVQFLRKMEALG